MEIDDKVIAALKQHGELPKVIEALETRCFSLRVDGDLLWENGNKAGSTRAHDIAGFLCTLIQALDPAWTEIEAKKHRAGTH